MRYTPPLAKKHARRYRYPHPREPRLCHRCQDYFLKTYRFKGKNYCPNCRSIVIIKRRSRTRRRRALLPPKIISWQEVFYYGGQQRKVAIAAHIRLVKNGSRVLVPKVISLSVKEGEKYPFFLPDSVNGTLSAYRTFQSKNQNYALLVVMRVVRVFGSVFLKLENFHCGPVEKMTSLIRAAKGEIYHK